MYEMILCAFMENGGALSMAFWVMPNEQALFLEQKFPFRALHPNIQRQYSESRLKVPTLYEI